jgi:quercetin dioxygenase-like cupin family protein
LPKITSAASPTTSTGALLPLVALPQQRLLSVNASDVPLFINGYGPGVSFQPLRLDAEHNEWVILATFAPGSGVPLHYHTGPAEVFTLQGSWGYKEYPDQPQTAGSYLYEPGGSVHTLFTPADNTEDTVMLIRVSGANINFDDDGGYLSILDAVAIRHLTDTLSAAQGLSVACYIAGGEADLTDASVAYGINGAGVSES